MQKRLPVGFDDLPKIGSVAPYAAARLPGPLTAATDGGDIGDEALTGNEAQPGPVASRPFEVDGNFYRVRRVDIDHRFGFNETQLHPDQALAVLKLAAERHGRNQTLLPLLQMALERLAGFHDDGVFVVFRLRADTPAERAVAPAPRPAAPAPAAFVPPPPPEAMMPVAQAVALKNAAATGVPFCEECARLAAARAAQSA